MSSTAQDARYLTYAGSLESQCQWVSHARVHVATLTIVTTTAGAVALLCWEICITFDDELEYIWPSVTFITPISFFCSDKLFQQAQLLSLKVALPFPPIFRLVRPTVCPWSHCSHYTAWHRPMQWLLDSLSVDFQHFYTNNTPYVQSLLGVSSRGRTESHVVYRYHFDDARLVHVRRGMRAPVLQNPCAFCSLLSL